MVAVCVSPAAPLGQRSGFALGALPDQGLAAFEFSGQAATGWQGGPGRQMTMASKLKRGGGTDLGAIRRQLRLPQQRRVPDRQLGVRHRGDLGQHGSRRWRFVRDRADPAPDGSWVRLPKLSGNLFFNSAGLTNVTISDSGVVVYTRRVASSGSLASMVVAAVWRPGGSAWSDVLNLPAGDGTLPRSSAPSATVTSTGRDRGVWLPAGRRLPAAFGRERQRAEHLGSVQSIDTGPSTVEDSSSSLDMQGEQQWAMASGSDGWVYLAVVMNNANAPVLQLLRRTPDGTWLPNRTTVSSNMFGRWGSSLWRVRILPGGRRRGDGALRIGQRRQPFELTSTDINSEGIASPAQQLVGGAFVGIFDTAVTASGEQAVVWSRWLATSPTPKMAVAVQRRAGTTGSWGTPELIAENTRIYSPACRVLRARTSRRA